MTVKIVNIPESKMAVYRATARQRHAERIIRLEQRFELAWQTARNGAQILKDEFNADKVVAFGSLLHPEHFHERSDIDLAAWSIEDRHYYRAAAAMLNLDAEFLVDLVQMEYASPSLHNAIVQEHVLL